MMGVLWARGGIRRFYLPAFGGAGILFGLYLMSQYSYLLFHSVAEIFSILVAFSIFIITWNFRRFLDTGYFRLIGVAYLFIGAVDLLHTLSYDGMGVFPITGSNQATQLWVTARYVESLSLLAAPLVMHRTLRMRLVLPGYTLVVGLLLAVIFYGGIFPDSYVEGVGLTWFKVASEYIIIAILLASLGLLLMRREEFDRDVLLLLAASIIITALSEAAFTLYVGVTGTFNLLGHFLKIVSFFLIYKAIVETGITRPFDILFRNLRQSERRYRELYEEAPSAYVTVGMDGRIVQANQQAVELLVYTRTELDNRPLFDLCAETPSGGEKARDLARRFLAGEEVVGEELEMVAADGSQLWVAFSARPIRDWRGRAIGGHCQMVDVTERMKVDRLKDEFISMVSHELRSPLTVIMGAINTALSEADRLPPEERRDLLRDAAWETESLSHLLENLIELSRAQANRLVLNVEPINIKGVVWDTLGRLRRQATECRFVVDIPGDLPLVSADEIRVGRILYNLLENAVKYSPDGGDIRVTARPEDGGVVIAVADRGIGMSAVDQEKLFGPFVRLDDAREKGIGGIGLGLVVCQRLIEVQGGRIWVESEPGRGSTFFFTLPAAG